MADLGAVGRIFGSSLTVSTNALRVATMPCDPIRISDQYEPRVWYADQGLLAGRVVDHLNAPMARLVRAWREDTGELVDETTSDATTGDFVLRTDAGTTVGHLVTAHPLSEDQRNAPRFARVMPVAG